MQDDKSGNHAYRAPHELGISDFKRKYTKKRMFKFFTYFKEKKKREIRYIQNIISLK